MDIETKFVFQAGNAEKICRWLSKRFPKDPIFPENIVQSIYYDTYDWDFVREKINSDYIKKKVRLRWYSDVNGALNGNASFIEAKIKIGSKRNKYRVQTSYSGDWLSNMALEDGRLEKIPSLLCATSPFLVPTFLIPICEIRYCRMRFLEPITRSRMCLDFDISIPRVNRRVLSFPCATGLKDGVFEFKGNVSNLPPELHQLTAFGCRKESFSKYFECVKQMLKGAI